MTFRSVMYNGEGSGQKHKNTLMPVYDWGDFLSDLQHTYGELKKSQSMMTERTRNVLGQRFTGIFHNNYSELSIKFDSLIERTSTKFENHHGALQESQQAISRLLTLFPLEQCYSHLIKIVSELLVSQQKHYQSFMKEEVFTIKQELQTVVIKNYEMEQEITRVYELYDKLKQNLDQEMNYRYQLEKNIVELEKELSSVKEENFQLTKANKSLIRSKHDLDEEVQITKKEHKILKKSQLQKFDKLKQQQIKTSQLLKQIQFLNSQILKLKHDLQASKNQKQDYFKEIQNLTQIIDTQLIEIQIYKNRDFRQSPSIKMQSIDKLHKYEDLVLQNYPQQSSGRSSLRSFMLSHQKSMGKLTLFQNRQPYDGNQKLLQKNSSCQKSLHSFERQNYIDSQQNDQQTQYDDMSLNMLGFQFPTLENQLTFRPRKENEFREEDIRWTEKRPQQRNKNEQLMLTQPQILSQRSSQIPQYRQHECIQGNQSQQKQKQQIYAVNKDSTEIEPLVISGGQKRINRQRSMSIGQTSTLTVGEMKMSRKLVYDSQNTGISQISQNADHFYSQENADYVEQNLQNDDCEIKSKEKNQQFQKEQKEQIQKEVEQHIKDYVVSSNISNLKNLSHSKKPLSVQKNSKFYLTKTNQPLNRKNDTHFPPSLSKKKRIPRTQSKKQFHQSQPININQILRTINIEITQTQSVKGVKNNKNDNQKRLKKSNETHMKTISNKNSRIKISPPVQWDNRSETNSVNMALIRRNIRTQKQVQQLAQKVQKAQVKIDEYEETIGELQSKLAYYKQQLSRSSIECINYKSAIQSLQTANCQLQQNLNEIQQQIIVKNNEIQEKDLKILQIQEEIKRLRQNIILIEKNYEERLHKVKLHCKQYIQNKHQEQITEIAEQYEEEIMEKDKVIESLKQELNEMKNKSHVNVQVMTESPFKNMKSIEVMTESPLQNMKSIEVMTESPLQNMKSIEVMTESPLQNMKSIEVITESPLQNMKSIEVMTESNIRNFQLCQKTVNFKIQLNKNTFNHKIQKLRLNQRQFDQKIQTTPIKQEKSKQFKIQSIKSSKININEPKKQRSLKFSLCPGIENINILNQKGIKISKLSVSNQVFSLRVGCSYQIDKKNQFQSPFQYTVKSPQISCKNSAFDIIENQIYSHENGVKSPFSNDDKSPHMQKKDGILIHTPSTQSCLQSYKPTENKSCFSQEDQHEFLEEKESFHTVEFLMGTKNSSRKSILQEQKEIESFFTCIQFENSSVQSIKHNLSMLSSVRYSAKKQSNQQMLLGSVLKMDEDNLQQINSDQDGKQISKIPSQNKQLQVQTVQQCQKNKPLQDLRQIVSKIEPDLISKFIQIQQQQSITRPRASSKHLKKSTQPYFKVTLPEEQKNHPNPSLQHFYSQSFQKHLTSYFKKHTNFIFTQRVTSENFIPDIQKMYLLHLFDLTNYKDQNNGKYFKSRPFLLHKRLIVDLQNDYKLQLPKSSMLKFITDDKKLVMGNFQIIITSDSQMRICRKNKRCFYLGQIQDMSWKIEAIQEIVPMTANNMNRKDSKI